MVSQVAIRRAIEKERRQWSDGEQSEFVKGVKLGLKICKRLLAEELARPKRGSSK